MGKVGLNSITELRLDCDREIEAGIHRSELP